MESQEFFSFCEKKKKKNKKGNLTGNLIRTEACRVAFKDASRVQYHNMAYT